MTTYYFSQAGNDSNTGLTTSDPWKTTAKFRSSVAAGDTALFNRGDTWDNDTASASGGLLHVAGNNIIVDAYGTGAKPKFSFTPAAAVANTTLTIASNVCTVVCAAHGITGNSAIVKIAGVTGAAVTANGFQKVTFISATSYSFALTAADGVSTDGTTQQVCRHFSVIFQNGMTGCSFSNLQGNNYQYMVLVNGSSDSTNCLFTDLDASYMGGAPYTHGNSSFSTGMVYTRCTSIYSRDDAWNWGATTAVNGHRGFLVDQCSATYCGYNIDGSAGLVSGGGDGYSCHSNNSGTIQNSIAGFCREGGITHVNTTGINYMLSNFIYECAEAGIAVNSGGTGIARNNRIIAPVITALQGSAGANACIDVSGTSPFEAYNNTLYTANGNYALGVWAMSFRGSGAIIAKDNLCISNGTAPLIQITSTSTYTSDSNGVSHTGSLFKTTATQQNWATWAAVHETNGRDCSSSNNINTLPPTTAAHFALIAGSPAIDNGANTSAVGVTTDYNGVARPQGAAYDIGSDEYVLPVGIKSKEIIVRRRR